jgi:hypothetical protein
MEAGADEQPSLVLLVRAALLGRTPGLRWRSARLGGHPSDLNDELRNPLCERVYRSLDRPVRRRIETIWLRLRRSLRR